MDMPLVEVSPSHAAFASSDTRSQVVACMLGRASIALSQATRFGCGAELSPFGRQGEEGYPRGHREVGKRNLSISAQTRSPLSRGKTGSYFRFML
jgi:hypothetical protein